MKFSILSCFLFTALLTIGMSCTTQKVGSAEKQDQALLIPGMTTQEVFGTLGSPPRRVGSVRFDGGDKVDVYEVVGNTGAETAGARKDVFLYFINNVLDTIDKDGRLWRQRAEEVYNRWSF